MLFAGCGGFIGSCGRYLVNRLCTHLWHSGFPAGTFIVNIIGCFLFGLFTGLFQRNSMMSEQANIILVTGFCGGFTTFSTFSGDIYSLFSKGEWLTASVYLTLSIIIGITMVIAGRYIALRGI